ncbi:MAG: hypothetical protein K6U74_01330 [Firmicutes bacterium]|nr:hypothetical protein [Bacillota bacterium]
MGRQAENAADGYLIDPFVLDERDSDLLPVQVAAAAGVGQRREACGPGNMRSEKRPQPNGVQEGSSPPAIMMVDPTTMKNPQRISAGSGPARAAKLPPAKELIAAAPIESAPSIFIIPPFG